MGTLIRDLKQYFMDALGVQVEPKLWKGKANFPLFLHDLYIFYTLLLHGKPCVLVVARESEKTTPADIRKHLELVQAKAGVPCIYVSQAASPYNRKRLIKHGIQFVVPRKQIHLPYVGIDWLESGRYSRMNRVVPKISPSSQAVVLYALMQRQDQFSPLRLAEALPYSTMTMTRVLDELGDLHLGRTLRKGKERLFLFSQEGSQLWEQVEPLLQNPVKRRVWLGIKGDNLKKIRKRGALAGLSALGELSMLSKPKIPIYAVSLETWKKLRHSGGIEEFPTAEEAVIELEIWSYDPMLFAKKGVIDYFSLYLSLRENQDERVGIALKKLMKEIKW